VVYLPETVQVSSHLAPNGANALFEFEGKNIPHRSTKDKTNVSAY